MAIGEGNFTWDSEAVDSLHHCLFWKVSTGAKGGLRNLFGGTWGGGLAEWLTAAACPILILKRETSCPGIHSSKIPHDELYS